MHGEILVKVEMDGEFHGHKVVRIVENQPRLHRLRSGQGFVGNHSLVQPHLKHTAKRVEYQ